MEIAEVLRKLKPLEPDQVEKWSRTLATAQPEARLLLERQVRLTAQRLLGDFEHRVLLSLPPQELATGQVHLGKVVYERDQWDFSLRLQELTQNLAIFGRSGAGKTNVSFHLLQQLVKKKMSFLFLDWKRTVRHLLPLLGKQIKVYTPGRKLAPFPFNPFIVPPGIDATAYVNQLVDVMADAYSLGDGAISVIQRALHTCYGQGLRAPTVPQLLDAMDALPSNPRSSGWKISARRACESLHYSETMGLDAKAQLKFTKQLLQQHTVIELDGISQSTKQFLIPLLCQWIYSVRLADNERETLRFVIFLEEAHHTLYRGTQRAKESLMNVLLRQCRELGMGIVLIDQHPHLISSAGLGNCYTTICMNLKDPNDINKAAGLSGLDSSEKRYFNQLSVGQGIVKLQDRWRQPFLVQFPLVEMQKGLVTDTLLTGLQQGTISWRELRERGGRQAMDGRHSPAKVIDLEAGSFHLLHDIAQHPQDGVDARYQRLGLSAHSGNRWKQQLVDNDLVRAERRQVGRTYRVLLRLTEQARRLMTPKTGNDPQASFLHEYWKQQVATQLESQGYRVELEAPRTRGGGKMDISATRGSENLAVEIETGKSDVLGNVKRDLLSGVTKVFVVATELQALDKIERHLAAAGLLLPEKVITVLAQEFHRSLGERSSH